jgi:D-cysteine desulfhydrase
MVQLVDVRGPGFGQASDEGEAAARLALRTEGLVLDPVYTAKAYAVVVRLRDHTGPIVFWHTGGLFSAAAHLPAAG